MNLLRSAFEDPFFRRCREAPEQQKKQIQQDDGAGRPGIALKHERTIPQAVFGGKDSGRMVIAGLVKSLIMKNDWKSLRDELIAFRDARDWKQFHKPKDLAAGLAIEAAELQEQFLWCTDAECEARIRDKTRRKAIAEELADVANYALLLADHMDLDLPAEMRRKIRINARKYPVSKSKGSARKYTEL